MENKKSLFAVELIIIIIIAAIVTLIYWPAVHNGFVWDDYAYLFDARFSDLALWMQKLHEPFIETFQSTPNYFRPLPLLSFLLQIRGHAPDSYTLHLANLILHALNTLMVGVLALEVSRSMVDRRKSVWIALPAVLIYGLHPSHIEVVAWISGRFDLMVTAFLLLALLADTFIPNRWARCTSVGLLFFAAASSKEMAIVFPLALFAWHLARHPRSLLPVKSLALSFVRSGELHVYLAILMGGFAYLYWRQAAFGYIYTETAAESPIPFLAHVLLITKSLGYYLLATIYPFNLTSPVHPLPSISHFNDIMAWISLLCVVVIIGLLTWLVRTTPRQGWAWMAYLLCYLPVIHLLHMSTSGNYVHDRYMYFPLVFFTLALTISLSTFFSQSRPQTTSARSALIACLLFFAGWSIVNIRVTIPLWNTDATLWTWAVIKQPESFLAHSNLAAVYYSQNRFKESMDEGLKALDLNPDSPSGWIAVGNALMGMGRYEEALTYQQTAVKIAPEWLDLVRFSAISLMRLGRYPDAEQILLSAHNANKWNRPVNLGLTVLYQKTGKMKLADQYFELATFGLSLESKKAYRIFVENELKAESQH